MPPITPDPSHISHSWCTYTPIAEMTKPPHQHTADTTPALRGPARSSHPPHRAALEPRKTKHSVYIQPRIGLSQSQTVVNNFHVSAGHSMECVMPSALVSGSQNTEKP